MLRAMRPTLLPLSFQHDCGAGTVLVSAVYTTSTSRRTSWRARGERAWRRTQGFKESVLSQGGYQRQLQGPMLRSVGMGCACVPQRRGVSVGRWRRAGAVCPGPLGARAPQQCASAARCLLPQKSFGSLGSLLA